MTRYDPAVHHRRSIRLSGYDYAQAGAYFITICTNDRVCSLGEVEDEAVRLSAAGEIVREVWSGLAGRFSDVATDAFAIMPNHIHGIIIVGAQFIAPWASASQTFVDGRAPAGAMNRAPTLGECVRTLKAASTRLIRVGPLPDFSWQRNYFERVIRGENELERVRNYIDTNPMNWATDENNPG